MLLPERPIVPEDNPSEADFVTVVRSKRATRPSSKTSAVANSANKGLSANPTAVVNSIKKPRTVQFGVRNSSLPVVQKRVINKSLFASRFSPDVTASDVEQSLRDQLQLASLVCTRLKTRHNSYASFHISVAENDFHLINNTGVWPNGCLIAPYYGRLNPDQIYTVATPVATCPPTPSPRDRSTSTPPPHDPAEVESVGVADESVGVADLALGLGAPVPS
jgi:hypothetical protein